MQQTPGKIYHSLIAHINNENISNLIKIINWRQVLHKYI